MTGVGYYKLQVPQDTDRPWRHCSHSLCTGVSSMSHDCHMTVKWLLCDGHMISREKFLFSGSVDHSIKTWDMETCEVVSSIPAHDNPVCTLTINGNRLYSGSLKSIKVGLSPDSKGCIILYHSSGSQLIVKLSFSNLLTVGSKSLKDPIDCP